MNTNTGIVPTEVLLPGDESLPELAAKANVAHHLVHDAAVDMVTHAIDAGEALSEAKGRVAHGEWLPWLAENFDGHETLGQKYMRIAANKERVLYLEETTLNGVLKVLGSGDDSPHVSHNSGENEWYTPPEYIAAARQVMGGIDLDPASTAEANTIVQAEQFYTQSDDGLAQEWHGRVWLNPPYAQPLIGKFSAKLVDEYKRENIEEACVLVNNATETDWFIQMGRVANAFCFPRTRVKFWAPGKVSAPLQGQAVLYFGANADKFLKVYQRFNGLVMPSE